MKLNPFIFALLVSIVSLAQTNEGYWDNIRATKETIVLKANEKKYIKSAEFPAGTTEVVFRITLLDENQQTSSSLVSLLKSIPDPTGISQGSAGAIFLLSKISGKDKCKFAVFTSLIDAENYVKTGSTASACFVQNNPVNKEVKLLAQNSGCINDKTTHLYFAFESDNWLLKENIEVEVVPWIDNNKSKGWNPTTKKEIISLALNNKIAQSVSNKDQFSGYFLDFITQKYTYKQFSELIPEEKSQVVSTFIEKSLTKTGDRKAISTSVRNQAENLYNSGKKQDAINLIQTQIIDKNLASAQDYNALGKYYLFTNQLNKAQETLETGVALDANLLSLQLNLAHVYLLNDNFSKSKSLHKNYFNQNINTDTTWVKQAQLDFIQLQKLGLESKNYKKILKMFN